MVTVLVRKTDPTPSMYNRRTLIQEVGNSLGNWQLGDKKRTVGKCRDWQKQEAGRPGAEVRRPQAKARWQELAETMREKHPSCVLLTLSSPAMGGMRSGTSWARRTCSSGWKPTMQTESRGRAWVQLPRKHSGRGARIACWRHSDPAHVAGHHKSHSWKQKHSIQ